MASLFLELYKNPLLNLAMIAEVVQQIQIVGVHGRIIAWK